jgi:hypothetical protein
MLRLGTKPQIFERENKIRARISSDVDKISAFYFALVKYNVDISPYLYFFLLNQFNLSLYRFLYRVYLSYNIKLYPL